MACSSYECKKRFECAQHYLNVEEDCTVEDYSHYGHGTLNEQECTVEYWCGELGDYKMFKPILFSKQVKRYLAILDDVYDFLDDMDETAGLSSTVMESCENLMTFFSELYRLSAANEMLPDKISVVDENDNVVASTDFTDEADNLKVWAALGLQQDDFYKE